MADWICFFLFPFSSVLGIRLPGLIPSLIPSQGYPARLSLFSEERVEGGEGFSCSPGRLSGARRG